MAHSDCGSFKKTDEIKCFNTFHRGSYWANYSTTLGAAIHELGHCFDLAHTPHGIMARGHDDMNHFFTVVSGEQGRKYCRILFSLKLHERKMEFHWTFCFFGQ